jgi:hypothetical protein
MTELYSNKNKEFTIAPHCPWYKEQQAYGPPNVNWCESTKCSWINEPANTWTNMGLIIGGLYIILKINQEKNLVIRDFGFAVIVCGFFSFTYHATNNFFSQFFDFLGMFMMTCLPLAIQTKRLQKQTVQNYHSYFWFYMFLSTCLFWFLYFWDIAVQQSVIIQVLSMFILELLCCYKEGNLKKMHYFWLCLIFMTFGQTISQLDLKRVWCDPENLFLHGHALWHITSGIAMVFLGMHFKKILNSKCA